MMMIPDHETFGMYLRRPDLVTPVNLMQRAMLWRERRIAKEQHTTVLLYHATLSMDVLNRWAKTSHGDLRRVAYALKTKFLHVLFLFGHMRVIEPEQQILKCHRCYKGIWEYNTDHAERCWKCNGTGIYKRILLWKFTVVIGGEIFEFHTPDSLVYWDMDEKRKVRGVELEDLPVYQDRRSARTNLNDRELHGHLLRVAVTIEKTMFTERVELNPLGRAVRWDVLQIANWITRPFYRAYLNWQTRNQDLPF